MRKSLFGLVVLIAMAFSACSINKAAEAGAFAAQILEKAFLYFTFLIAPPFYLFGSGLAVANLFAARGTRKRYAVGGLLLNGLGLFFAAVGWILFLLLMFLVMSGADFVGPWR